MDKPSFPLFVTCHSLVVTESSKLGFETDSCQLTHSREKKSCSSLDLRLGGRGQVIVDLKGSGDCLFLKIGILHYKP